MNMVGYLTQHPDGLEGERGLCYDYVLASNGLFIEAEGKRMAARVPVAGCEVRGLAPLEPKFVLRYGRIPQRFFDLALSTFLVDTSKERYVAVTWQDGYHLYVPEQETEEAKVDYQVGDSIALELHSHGKMAAMFSSKDNKDETGMKLYGVVGKLDGTPVVQLRVGVYGYFHPVPWVDVFDGYLMGAEDWLETSLLGIEEKEVIDDDELYSVLVGQPGSPENRGGWLRRHWWFCRRGSVPAIDV